MTEPAALASLVPNLADTLRLERDPLGVGIVAPAARAAGRAILAEVRTFLERGKHVAELAAFLARNAEVCLSASHPAAPDLL